MNVRIQASATALFAALVLAGCASKTPLTEAPVESRTGTPPAAASSTTGLNSSFSTKLSKSK